ncbi:MAG TPA: transcription-repair coupling factor [Candidatus Krumholzibacteria bacterium]|nr:transcription-repair coupling factor [Candidatus Krumholzibacteria bacterium]
MDDAAGSAVGTAATAAGLLGRLLPREAPAEGVAALASALERRPGQDPVLLSGLHGSSPSLLLASWFQAHRRTLLAVAPTRDAALRLADDLEAWLGADAVVYLPQPEVLAFDRNSPDPDLTGALLAGLRRLRDPEPALAVTSLAALRHRVLAPARLASASFTLTVDQRVDREALGERLTALGYQPVGTVARTGDFAVRGSLVDLHPPGSPAVRVEFFDDEIVSLRTFSASDQRTTGRLERVEVLPVSHLILDDDGVLEALGRVEAAAAAGEIDGDDRVDLEARIEERLHGGGLEAFLPLYGPTALLSDHLPAGAPVVWVDPARLSEQSDLLDEEAPRMRAARLHHDAWLPDVEELVAGRDALDFADRPTAWLTGAWIAGDAASAWLDRTPAAEMNQGTSRPGLSGGDVAELGRRLADWEERGLRAAVLCDNRGQAARLGDLLMEQDGPVPSGLPVVGRLSEGFVWPAAGVALVTDHEFFERYQRPTRSRFRGEAVVKDSGNLQPGEHVVHVEYGIGRYRGLRRIAVEGTERECLLIDFADDDKVYVPVENIDLVERYSSDRSAAPELSRLGTASWARVTKKARKAIQAMAAELLELYAARESRPGYAFPDDGDLMRSLEESFIHQETKDQLSAIADVKKDMEKSRPMDRLVCGDVGYGKTEVAMRAAFKAVEAGKQVAVLCPTTLLAHQHAETFGERFRDFPAKVEVLSRFRSPQQSREIMRKVRDKEIDVLIGTHRLLSRDVKFGDLGLLVIDEEHRFGVRHKERLKQLRKEVDVMTLSATPIPRTLYLSLMGARDMSLINTPPRDRLPIHTELCAWDEELLREAILRELHRGGQVFFVHNRVETIQGVAATIAGLLPNIRVAVAHGQMKEEELEKVMGRFLAQEADVLVTTTIIESGLDMPRVNTIIIDRADRFGLAQLYQIRGRVGRSNQRAFAYLMTPPGEALTPDARRRLSALQEFQALGSGYHIAMRDLEIRGAGNILGQQQHGHLEAIGFDLYCRLLDEAVRELKGGGASALLDVRVDLRLPAFLPDDYIADPETKMDLYRRLARVREERAFAWLRDEIQDRFGPLPEPVKNLLDISRIRLLAARNGVEEVRAGRRGLSLFFAGGREPTPHIIRGLMGTGPKGLQFKAVDQFVMQIPAGRDQLGAAAFAVLDLLDRLAEDSAPVPAGRAGGTDATPKEKP